MVRTSDYEYGGYGFQSQKLAEILRQWRKPKPSPTVTPSDSKEPSSGSNSLSSRLLKWKKELERKI